jgi:hypothetical protein
VVTADVRLQQAKEFDPGIPSGQRDAHQGEPGSKARQFIADVEKRIDDTRESVDALWTRMDKDYGTYRGEAFRPNPEEGIAQEDTYTSNQPRVDADTVVGYGAAARRIIRVMDDDSQRDVRDANSNAERFAVGVLDLGDQKQMRARGKRGIQEQLMWYASIRGGYAAARALLIKDEDGETDVEIQPLDPRHLLVQFGAKEPVWAAYLTMRSRTSLSSEYGIKWDGGDENSDGARQVRVIDYTYRVKKPRVVDNRRSGRFIYVNCVIANHRFAKRPAPTFSTVFPVIIRAVGSNPGVASFDLRYETGESRAIPGHEDFGESVFAANRNIIKTKNRMFTYGVSLTAKAAQERFKVFSNTGTFRLPDNPADKGSEFHLARNQGQDVESVPVQELSRDIQWLNAGIAQETVAGGLPEIAKGIMQGAVSGAALSIAGESITRLVDPPMRAVESCLEGIVEALIGQFETGGYDPIRVRGRTYDSVRFDRFIEPESLEGHGPLTVELLPKLPRDDQAMWQMAAFAATAGLDGEPLAGSHYIRENIIKMQDPDLERERIYAGMAVKTDPMVLLATQIASAVKEGEMEVAQTLAVQLQRMHRQQQMEDMAREMAFAAQFGQAPIPTAAGGMNAISPAGNAGGGGQQQQQSPTANMEPEIMPLSGTPFGQPNASPEAGINGLTPRPGAQGEEQQALNALGLFGVNQV